MSRNRRRGPRSSRVRGASSAHWLNLGLTVLTLVMLLMGIRVLGSGAANCFMTVSGSPEDAAPDVAAPPGDDAPELGVDTAPE